MGNRWSILSVTDLHYEQPDANYVDDPKELDWPPFREEIFSSFDAILKSIAPGACDLVAVAGDLTTHGKKAGIDRFEHDALPALLLVAGKPEAVCIVPGNHDVVWGLEPTTPGAFQTKFEAFSDLVRRGQLTSCLMPGGVVTTSPGDRLTFVKPPNGPLYIDPDRKLLVACVNSAIRCGEVNVRMRREIADNATAAGAAMAAAGSTAGREPLDRLSKALPPYLIRDVAQVTDAQQRAINDALSDAHKRLGEEWGAYLRVGLLHHHVLQFPDQIVEHRGYEALVDGGRLLSMFADFDFDLVLTGHKHQPYEVVYRTRSGKDLLVVGGPTVGGYSAGDSFRGLRWIDLEESGDQLLIGVTDLRYQAGTGNVVARVEELRKATRAKPYARRPGTALEQRALGAGYSYREMSSITIIEPDGDARRVVECVDLVVTDPNLPRAGQHPIELPPTSGYLANLRARGERLSLKVRDDVPRDLRRKRWETVLTFDQKIGTQPATYSYRWFAVNAFALDTEQFDYLHGRDPVGLDNVEFTHFVTGDPVRELTVVVSFPPGYELPAEPRLRIAFVNGAEPDARQWKIDTTTQDELSKVHALRYYESLQIAALRVSLPRPNLSYGIRWDVPEPASPPLDDGVTSAFWQEWSRPDVADRSQAAIIEILRQMFGAVRATFLGDWAGPIDGTLMWFDPASDRPLVILAGANGALRRKRGQVDLDAEPLPQPASLSYGDGIAGRAFKANRVRVYVAGDKTGVDDEPDYYTRLPGGPLHKILVSLPVHVPEPNEVFKARARVYESKRPYGVLNVGSVSPDSPLKDLRVPERILDVLTFQHRMNVHIYDSLRRFVKHARSVDTRRRGP